MAIIAMFRINPQLGAYCTFEEVTIKRQSKTQIVVDYHGSERKFNTDGTLKKAVNSVYGSIDYHLYTSMDEVKRMYKGDKFGDYRISSGKEILDNLCQK